MTESEEYMNCKRIAFYNEKGGVGKTTGIINVAGVLSKKGEKVLVIDLDKQRNSTLTLLSNNTETTEFTIYDFMKNNAHLDNVVKKALFQSHGNANPKYYGVDVLSSDKRLEDESKLKDVNIKDDLDSFIEKGEYTWVLVDMPPSNKTINEICFSQIVDYVIVPFSSDLYSVTGYGDLMETINTARLYTDNLHILGIYLSRHMYNCAVDHYIKDQLSAFGDLFIDVQIPFRADIRECAMFSRPISYYKKSSPSKIAYENLVNYMENKIHETRKDV